MMVGSFNSQHNRWQGKELFVQFKHLSGQKTLPAIVLVPLGTWFYKEVTYKKLIKNG
jgi:hypothetical protein